MHACCGEVDDEGLLVGLLDEVVRRHEVHVRARGGGHG